MGRRQGEDFMVSSRDGRGPQTRDPNRGEHSRLAQVRSTGPQSSPALEAAISDAIVTAEKIMQKIDSRSATAESADDFERELSVEESNVTVENSFSTG
jgi:hypothetical protein